MAKLEPRPSMADVGGWTVAFSGDPAPGALLDKSGGGVGMTTFDERFIQPLVALGPQLRAFARSLCGDPDLAEDLVQDAFENALKAHGSFAPGTNLRAWAFTIVRNQFYSHRRRSWRSRSLDPEIAERVLTLAPHQEHALHLNDLHRALSHLAPSDREALILIGAAGLSYRDAAAVAGVTTGTIKIRVSRARSRLASTLGDIADGRVAAITFDREAAAAAGLGLLPINDVPAKPTQRQAPRAHDRTTVGRDPSPARGVYMTPATRPR